MKALVKLFVLLPAAVTAIGLAGCSSSTTPPKADKSQPEAEETAAPYPELAAANTQQKMQALAAKCAKDIELYSSSYGVWKKSKPCKLPVTSTLSISISGFHKDNSGVIDALQAITASPELVTILSGRYPGGYVASHGEVCVKLGKSGLPVLFIAGRSRCDALAYGNI